MPTMKEYRKIEELFAQLSENDSALDEKLREKFPLRAQTIRKDLETGVDQFYATYSRDVTSETIKGLLTERLSGLSVREQYAALSNILVALTHINGRIADDQEWTRAAKEHSLTLEALDIELMERTDEELSQEIDDMLTMIADDVDASAVLFFGEPPYQKLLDACLEGEDPEKVEALAIHQRDASVRMAAALYLLHEAGEMPSLGDEPIAAQDIGVVAATMMEIDAAFKSGSLEAAKAVLDKAAKVCIALLISSPDLLKNLAFFAVVALLTDLNGIWMLVAGAIMVVNMKLNGGKVGDYAEKVYRAGGRLLNAALAKTKEVVGGVNAWLMMSVYPRAQKIWHDCKDFVVNRVLLPAASFVMKAKDRLTTWADGVVESAGRFIDRVRALNREQAEETHDETGETIEDSYPTEVGEATEDFVDEDWGLSEDDLNAFENDSESTKPAKEGEAELEM